MTTEVRSVSSTGGEKGVKPQRHSLIPRKALDVIAEVYHFGCKKYDDHNWRKGYEWSKSYDALQRHITAWWDGEETDSCPDDCPTFSETGDRTCKNHSGLSHLGHAGWHVFALIVFRFNPRYAKFDDRYKEPEE